MTKRLKIELNLLLFLFTSVVVGIFFGIYNRKEDVRLVFQLPAVASFQNPVPTSTTVPKIITLSQISPDGTHNLTLKVISNINLRKVYTFTTSEQEKTENQLIYEVSLPFSEKMSIPFNTWSPDNKYVFVQHETASGSAVLVIKKDRQPFSKEELYLDVTKIFNEKYNEYTFQKATGWASETLIIVNTLNPDESKGPSFWFEVPSKQFYQLYTEF